MDGDSAVGRTGRIFYNTLFDENATQPHRLRAGIEGDAAGTWRAGRPRSSLEAGINVSRARTPTS